MRQIDKEYKVDQVAKLRQQATGALYEKAETLLDGKEFEEAIATLGSLRKRTEYGDPNNVAERARKGIADRELRKKLDALYDRAVQHLKARQYEECLNAMAEIHSEERDYDDPRDVEQRARNSWCGLLYTQALGALTQKRYQDALDHWNEICEINPHYVDTQNIQEQALLGLNKPDWFAFLKKFKPTPREAKGEKKRLSKPVLYGIIAVVAIVILLGGGWSVSQFISNRNATVTAIALDTQIAMTATEQANVQATENVAAKMKTATAEYLAVQGTKKTATQEAMATATREAMATATQEAMATKTQEAITTATQEAIETATQVAIPTLTKAAIQTATKAAIQTATAQPTPTPTIMPTPVPQAKAEQASSVYEGPHSGTKELDIVVAGATVPILGCADERKHGRWLYVQASEDIKGFVYAPRFEYTVEWESLEIVEAEVVLVSTPTPTGPVSGQLEIQPPGELKIVHIWPATVCTGKGKWVAYFEVKISGGDGKNYKIYWDDEPLTYAVKESEKDVAVIQRPGIVGLLVGTVWVESGGQRVGLATSASIPANCD